VGFLGKRAIFEGKIMSILSRGRLAVVLAACVTLGACASEPVAHYARPGATAEEAKADSQACYTAARAEAQSVTNSNPPIGSNGAPQPAVLTDTKKIPMEQMAKQSYDTCMKDRGYTAQS
jgi:hypothetical protein